MQPKWGHCIPSGCTATDVYNNYAILFAPVHSIGLPVSCQTVETQEEIKELGTDSIGVM